METEKPIIGIPVFQDRECFEAMWHSLGQSTSWYDRIIIIESDGDKEYWDNFLKDTVGVEVISTPKNGPLKAYNQLFEIAKRENKDLFITQTDVLFPKLYKRDWLQQMSMFSQYPEIGLVTPINGGGHSGPDYLEGLYWVGGWATYISKKCWEVFDGYDKNFIKGWGVDIDMTYAISQKYKAYRMNYWCDHHQMNNRNHETSPTAEQEKQEAASYFRKKWGLDK